MSSILCLSEQHSANQSPLSHQRRLDELDVEAEDGAAVRVQLQDPDGRHDAAKVFSIHHVTYWLIITKPTPDEIEEDAGAEPPELLALPVAERVEPLQRDHDDPDRQLPKVVVLLGETDGKRKVMWLIEGEKEVPFHLPIHFRCFSSSTEGCCWEKQEYAKFWDFRPPLSLLSAFHASY